MEDRGLLRDLAVGALGAVGGVLVAAIGLKEVLIQDSTEQTRLILEQNLQLQSQINRYRDDEAVWREAAAEMRSRIASQDADIIRLKLAVETKTGEPRGNLIRYLNALSTPAWAKEYAPDADEFRMLHITYEYEVAHCISVDRYRHKTDAEVHSAHLAKLYEQHDREVLLSRSSIKFAELVYNCQHDSEEIREYIKFWLQLSDGTEIVGGIQVSP